VYPILFCKNFSITIRQKVKITSCVNAKIGANIVEKFGKNVDYSVVVALTAEVKYEELKQVVNLSAYILFTVVAGEILLQKIQNHINNEP
jgi:hypothetical protein